GERHVGGVAPERMHRQAAPFLEQADREDQVEHVSQGQDHEARRQNHRRLAVGRPEQAQEDGEEEQVDQQLVAQLQPEQRRGLLDVLMVPAERPPRAHEQRGQQEDRRPYVAVQRQEDERRREQQHARDEERAPGDELEEQV